MARRSTGMSENPWRRPCQHSQCCRERLYNTPCLGVRAVQLPCWIPTKYEEVEKNNFWMRVGMGTCVTARECTAGCYVENCQTFLQLLGKGQLSCNVCNAYCLNRKTLRGILILYLCEWMGARRKQTCAQMFIVVRWFPCVQLTINWVSFFT